MKAAGTGDLFAAWGGWVKSLKPFDLLTGRSLLRLARKFPKENFPHVLTKRGFEE